MQMKTTIRPHFTTKKLVKSLTISNTGEKLKQSSFYTAGGTTHLATRLEDNLSLLGASRFVCRPYTELASQCAKRMICPSLGKGMGAERQRWGP